MKRFQLRRLEDETGVSGIGVVAEGIQFSNGYCVICWLNTGSTGNYNSMKIIELIHGHSGKTIIEWID